MEIIGKNADLATLIEMRTMKRTGRGIIMPLYEAAVKAVGGRPLSLLAAEKIMERVKSGDSVIIMTGMGQLPNMPYGETDGPPGVASMARGIRYGLGAIPIIMTETRDMEPVKETTKAAGLAIVDYKEAKDTNQGVFSVIPFPYQDAAESQKQAARIMEQYKPKLVVAIEMLGPNKKGVKHWSSGFAAETSERTCGLEHIFYEAHKRKILTIACIDQGNEMGSGTIEETIRKEIPYGNECRCPCGGGMACTVKSDILFPAAISNWAAYAIIGMLGLLLKKPSILQDEDTERRMLEACIMEGSVDGVSGGPLMGVDGVGLKVHQGLINMLHTIIDNALL